MMHGATNPRREAKKHTHHHESSHRRRHNKEGEVMNLFVWMVVVVLSVVPAHKTQHWSEWG